MIHEVHTMRRFLLLSCRSILLACLCLALCAPTAAGDQCSYVDPEYSVYNRLLKVTVLRLGEEVGTVRFSFQFNGYYVRCVNGGLESKRFFTRARDARWAACDACY
jgi:hypothetical protein